ncbi:MAG TPA: DUF1801 domain-containing protein [Pyrinomonadaceae bacterium]|nr:DUF1801 domain-containing protein [Pyrinomonadaceae bacterium]
MSGYPPPAPLKKFLKPFDHAIQELALELRALLLEEIAPCHENIYDAYSALAIGYGSSEHLSDNVFHIAVYKDHVNLGFNQGASLDDPKNILEGAGSQIRHIKIWRTDDLERPELRSYIRRARRVALDDARKLGETSEAKKRKPAKYRFGPPTEADGVISVVKAIYPKRRRPDQASKKR